jgi:hypothetical protein
VLAHSLMTVIAAAAWWVADDDGHFETWKADA